MEYYSAIKVRIYHLHQNGCNISLSEISLTQILQLRKKKGKIKKHKQKRRNACVYQYCFNYSFMKLCFILSQSSS